MLQRQAFRNYFGHFRRNGNACQIHSGNVQLFLQRFVEVLLREKPALHQHCAEMLPGTFVKFQALLQLGNRDFSVGKQHFTKACLPHTENPPAMRTYPLLLMRGS